jgi:hypothetical protein
LSGDSRRVRPRQHDKVTVAVRSTKIKEDEDDSWNNEPSIAAAEPRGGMPTCTLVIKLRFLNEGDEASRKC